MNDGPYATLECTARAMIAAMSAHCAQWSRQKRPSEAARGRGQPWHVPRLERALPRLCPGGRSGPKLIEFTQKIKRRATAKLQHRRLSSQYQCHDTVAYFRLLLWLVRQISYTAVITRLQVAESSRTSTIPLSLSRVCNKHKDQRFT